MSLVTRISRFGIFTKNRPPHESKLGSEPSTSQKPSEDKPKKQTLPEVQTSSVADSPKPSNVTTIDSIRPSYFGYLSGVVSSLWKADQTKIQDGQTVVTSPPVKEKKAKIIVRRISRNEVVNKTRTLVKAFLTSDIQDDKIQKTKDLIQHLIEFPASRLVAVQTYPELISSLLKLLNEVEQVSAKGLVRKCLAMLGYVKSVKGSGIKVLAVDGGGTRGMMGLEVLAELENRLGTRICEQFDMICGVSTGAIISVLLGAKRMKVQEAKEIYMDISRQLFNQGKFSGVSGLLLSHSYYNTKKWIDILKKTLGDDRVIDTAQDDDAVKLAVISCIVNAAQLQPFVFRNYEHPAGRDSHFRGGTEHKLWQAVQASAAAPGYFEEVSLGTVLHQDGGVLANNPTAIALHEARLLWPNENIQCVVSVGNGRTVSELELSSTVSNTGIQDKVSKIVDSATDTELIHNAMSDLLPHQTYYRLNPYMTYPYTLDEIDPYRLDQMIADARAYVRRNREKIADASYQLTRPPAFWKMAQRAVTHVKTVNGHYSPQ